MLEQEVDWRYHSLIGPIQVSNGLSIAEFSRQTGLGAKGLRYSVYPVVIQFKSFASIKY